MHQTLILLPTIRRGRSEYSASTTIGELEKQSSVGAKWQSGNSRRRRILRWQWRKETNSRPVFRRKQRELARLMEGAGKPMDIDAIRAKTKCFGCGQLGHFKRDCPKRAKTKEEHLRRVNYYWDHVATKEKTDTKVEEVKDEAEQ